MTQTAAPAAALPAWGVAILAALAGACGALGHPPYDLPVAIVVPMIAGFVFLHMARTPRGALAFGWALGFGYFGLTLSWITEPFQVDAAETGWMAPFAVVLLALLLGAFWAAAMSFARWAGGRPWMLAVAWAGAELLRAYVFTGFPWAMLPQALVDLRLGQGLAWLGPHGLTLGLLGAIALGFTYPNAQFPGAVRLRMLMGGVVAVAALFLIRPIGVETPSLTDHTVRLIQPNAPQHEKWDPEKIPVFVNRQIDFTGAGDTVPDLIVWPETALPYLQEYAQPAFDAIAQAARGAPVALGIQRSDDRGYYNGMVVLDAAGQVIQSYDKHHLVPFGEYMPLPGLFRSLGIRALADRADSGYQSGPGPRVLDLGALGTALPLICYEAVFAHDVGGAATRPDFLMQLTNDAWFGMRSGPQQHLAQARMRAIEQGLPLIRAANTGISAVIDPKGRITASLALNTAGYLDAGLPAAAAPTLYARTGDLPWVFVVLAGLIAAVLHRARTRRTRTIDAGTHDA
ncbi:apolipoprotein N-acyltransferase [uncultured Tateyamaria sp.]|uniref:apolipoprotein N-acyltransferase n=1 Tax=uncultured Tateyamaria sp. TaxID=455651 RepID=UPI0026254EE4|nr:apolipoprotein N-acyltransferase [uncultured Tateyamaria sp.]